MPAGLVIVALAVIALVAFVALFIFGGSSEGSPATNTVGQTDGALAGPAPSGNDSEGKISGAHSIDRVDHPRLLSRLMVLPSGR